MTEASRSAEESEGVVDFEVAKVERVLRSRRGEAELLVTRRGRAITIRRVPRGAGRGAAGHEWIAQLRAETAGRYAVYWARAVGGWESYGFTGSLDACLAEIRRDAYGCFWG